MSHFYTLKPINISELNSVLCSTWANLPQGSVDEAVLSFRKSLQACITGARRYLKHDVWTDVAMLYVIFSARL